MSVEFGSLDCVDVVAGGGGLLSAVDIVVGGGALVVTGLVLGPPGVPPLEVPPLLPAPVGLAPELPPPPAVMAAVVSSGPILQTDRLTFDLAQETEGPRVLHPLNTVVEVIVGRGSRLLAMALMGMVKLSTG
jgi:hypothetical protein